MEPKQKFPWWVIILVVVVLCGLCVVVLAAGAIAFPLITNRVQSPVNDLVQTFVPEPSLQIAPPFQPFPTSSFDPGTDPVTPGLTGMQIYEGTYFYDDFSSDALGWPVANDDLSILQYENGQYRFQVLEADTTDWVYAPIDFLATDIWFDVQGLPGDQNGTFGVFCQDQDNENYYFVEFDLEIRSYMVGVVDNDEFSYLTPENADGFNWVENFAINSNPQQVNRIGVICTLDNISLYINGDWVDDFNVPSPFETSGKIALFVYAFDFADENGYKVFFDNVEIY